MLDDFLLELSFKPPNQKEEDAVREFLQWLKSIPIVAGLGSSSDLVVGEPVAAIYSSDLLRAYATAEAVADTLAEFADIRGTRPPSAEELALAKTSLTRGYPRGFETADQLAGAAITLALYGLPDQYFEQFMPKIAAVSGDDVVRVSRRYLNPDLMTTLVVGLATSGLAVVEALLVDGAPVRAVDRAMQTHGAMGFTNEVGLHHAWHSLRIVNVADGTNEILNRSIVQRLLRGDTEV